MTPNTVFQHLSRRALLTTMVMIYFITCVSTEASLKLRYTVLEELPIGTVVADDVIERLSLHHGYSSEISRTLTLSIVHGWRDFVELDKQKRNRLVTRKRFDREFICQTRESLTSGQECLISVDVAVHPAQYFQIIGIEVLIQDVNDNDPVFSQANIKRVISESANLETQILLPSAVDADLPPYSVAEYTLTSADPQIHPFRLIWNTTSPDRLYERNDLRLELVDTLDRETVEIYNFTVTAYDGDKSSSRRSSTLNVLIEISDVNDNSPRFQRESYDVTMPSDYVSGSEIARVLATDADKGLNGNIRYGFSRRTQAVSGRLFVIDQVTGVVSLARRYNEGLLLSLAEHKLIITATDQGENSMPSVVTLAIFIPETLRERSHGSLHGIHEVEARHLVINVETIDGTNDTAHILENNPPGSFLAHITVETLPAGTELDDDDEEDVICSISVTRSASGELFSSRIFELQAFYGKRDFKLVAAASLDRERCAVYDVTILCETMSQMTASAVVVVTAEDVDDNPPIFERDIYECDIKENNRIGDFVISVRAHDDDVDSDKSLKHSRHVRSSVQAAAFVSSDGTETYPSTPNREQVVSSTDSKIEVDSNAVKPATKFLHHEGGSVENRMKRNYRDRRQHLRAELIYQLESSAAENYFRINSNTGQIYARISFDRETKQQYEFYVYAITRYSSSSSLQTNSAGSRDDTRVALSEAVSSSNTTARCLVKVQILDEDDEKATFSKPWYRFNVSESVGSGTKVGSVQAIDRDLPHNSVFLYRLAPHDISGSTQFAIEPDTGDIYTRKQLDRESVSHYTLKVMTVAMTSSSPTSSGQEDDAVFVFIRVIDANDHAPAFSFPSPDGSSVWKLSAGAARDAVVLSANDLDEGENGRVSYNLLSGSDEHNHFRVDQASGVLTWTATLNDNADNTFAEYPSIKNHSTPQNVRPFKPTTIPVSQCPLVVRVRATDHSISDASLSTTAILFVLPQDCNWSPTSREHLNFISDTNMTSSDHSSDLLSPFFILIIAGVIGALVVISIILTVACFVCRRRSKSSYKSRDNNSAPRDCQEDGQKVAEKMLRQDKDEDMESEEGEAFLMIDKTDRSGQDDAPGAIVLYVKDPKGFRDPEAVARFQIHPMPEAGGSALYTSRRGRRADSVESGLFTSRSDRDTDSGYMDIASV